MNGDGHPTESSADAYAAAFPTSPREEVCESNCNGYELARSLDFNDPGSYASGTVNTAWTTGSGWLPIGKFSDDYGFGATLVLFPDSFVRI